MNNKKTVGILGAGISGLCTAYTLKKSGIPVTVYEKNDVAGGVIQSRKKNGWLVEKGPNTMLVKDQKVWDFLDELNLTGRIKEPCKTAKKRFIVRNAKLHATPSSLLEFLTTPLLSTTAKLRLLKEPFIKPSNRKDKSIAEFITRRFGQEPLDYGVNPFTAGIYAGNPEQLSIKHTFSSLHKMEQKYGSVTKGLLKRKRDKSTRKALLSFDEGMQVLPQIIAAKLGDTLRPGAEVKQVSKTETGWKVHIQTENKRVTHEHAAIISTLPSYCLPGIWADSTSAQYIQKLSEIKYAPVSVMAVGFKKDQIEHSLNGFGFLIPEKEPFNLLGCLFSSTLFANRSPENHVLLTCFMGGMRNPKLADASIGELLSGAVKDLEYLLDIKGDPVFVHHTVYRNAIPQFYTGYDEYFTAIKEIENENRGFFIGGNFRSGVSVPDGMAAAFEMAIRVKTY